MSGEPMPPAAVYAAMDAARAYLRADADAEPTVFASLAATALALAEAYIGRALIVRGFEDIVAADGAWHPLRAMPVAVIDGITALPDGGAPGVLPVADYAIDIDDEGVGRVRIATGAAPRGAVGYHAGLADGWAALPPPIAQGIAMLVGHLFDNREGEAPPAAVAALWRPFRRMRIEAAR